MEQEGVPYASIRTKKYSFDHFLSERDCACREGVLFERRCFSLRKGGQHTPSCSTALNEVRNDTPPGFPFSSRFLLLNNALNTKECVDLPSGAKKASFEGRSYEANIVVSKREVQ